MHPLQLCPSCLFRSTDASVRLFSLMSLSKSGGRGLPHRQQPRPPTALSRWGPRAPLSWGPAHSGQESWSPIRRPWHHIGSCHVQGADSFGLRMAMVWFYEAVFISDLKQVHREAPLMLHLVTGGASLWEGQGKCWLLHSILWLSG